MISKLKILGIILIAFNFSGLEAKAADEIIIYKGILSRKISIYDLEELANKKKPKGTLKNLIKLSKEKESKISEILTQEFELPIVLTSKLIYSKIGTVIIQRVAKIVYPNKNRQHAVSVPAIRSAIIQGIVKGNGRITLIEFLKCYPNKKIAIDYTSLNKVINKVESMTDLVEFFSEGPLEKLKKGNSKA